MSGVPSNRQSQHCINTKGCKFESALQALTKKGNAVGKKLQLIEVAHLQNKLFDDNDIKKTTGECNELNAIIKDGMKKLTAIKTWLKVT